MTRALRAAARLPGAILRDLATWAAAAHDRTTWVRVNGRRYDADRVPAREDVEDEGA